MNEITVRKQASGSHLRDGARQTWLEKKNGIEIFNLTYAELSILRDQILGFIEVCTRNADRNPARATLTKVERMMNEMVKIKVV